MEEDFVCCICGRRHKGMGNDPWPVVEDEGARCCNGCNAYVVVPARIAGLDAAKEHFYG